MDRDRVEAVLGYALAVAAQADDWRDRELGPIHLLKYLYLADLAHAEAHGGKSFTGIHWRFHKFGPWAVEAYCQLDPSLAALGADRRRFSSQYREDNVRWKLPPDQLEKREAPLPGDVARAVARAVRAFGPETSSLLHHVYRTPPMLRAAPGDPLNLAPQSTTEPPPAEPLPKVELSKTRVKKMREEVRQRLARKRERRRTVAPHPPPRYDDVFEEGVAWLDGPEVEPRRGRLSFSDDIWTSQARGDDDLP